MDYFVINEKLPSLNEVINQNRTNRYAAAKFKSEIEDLISLYIKTALKNGTLHERESPCFIYIEWREKNKKRDVDNIQSSQKFILDSLVKTGVLKNDSRKYVKGIAHNVVDADENSVKVVFANKIWTNLE